MPTVRLACLAMGTRFELLISGEDPVRLRAAGEEALAEIRRLHAQLSFFDRTSDISRINARAAEGPVRVEPRLFALLQHARQLYDETRGAFDVTVAPLMRTWGFYREQRQLPPASEIDSAIGVTGMHLIELDPSAKTVSFKRPGVMIDLGGIGKGYAVDEAIAIIRDAGVENAFIHGGTSTSYGLGSPSESDAWQVAIPYPGSSEEQRKEDVVAVAPLADAALSVSAVWGKAFEAGGKHYGHVLDPREGRPVDGAILSAVVSSSATDSDALSTAFLVHGRRSKALLDQAHAGVQALLLFPSSESGVHDVIERGLSSFPSRRRRVVQPI